MPNNYTKVKRNDAKLLLWIIAGFLFVAWLCSPPGNKFLQICFWGNNTKLFISKIMNSDENKLYMFHRNNAVYLAKMFPKDKRKAMQEINKAITLLPSYADDKVLQSLYRDRAYIQMYYGENIGALNDFMHSGELQFMDYLPVALLFKENGDYRNALSYCNGILNVDMNAYAGYACLSDIYDSAGRPEIAERIWNLAIDRKSNNPKFYVERSKIRTKLGDEEGASTDLAKAREYIPNIDINQSIVEDTLHHKVLPLTIK